MVAPHDQVTRAVSANIVFETVVLHRFQARYGLQTLAQGSATEGSTKTNEDCRTVDLPDHGNTKVSSVRQERRERERK